MTNPTLETPSTVVDLDADAFYLHSPADLKAAVIMGQGRVSEINGQPVKYFWADGIRTGDYTHPTKGFSLSVDRKRMDGWVENFRRMQANSVDVHACADHSEKARDSLGYVVDMKRDGDTLKVLHQLIGEDAIRMASRNKISLGIHPKFKDGRGVSYGDSIIHSALTPVPVVPSRDGLIAASRGQQDKEPVILTLAASRSTAMPFSATQLDEIRKLPGAGEISEDGAAEWLLSYAAQAGANCVTLSAERDTLQSQIVTLSRDDDAPAVDPEIIADRAELYRGKIELSVARGEMPATIAKKLMPMVRKESPSVVMLSRNDEGHRPLDLILDLFTGEKLNPVGPQKTGIQTLSRMTPSDAPDELKVEDNPLLKRRDELLKEINQK